MTRGWRGAWSRKQVVDGVYQLDEGALLDDFFSFLQELGLGTGWVTFRAQGASAP